MDADMIPLKPAGRSDKVFDINPVLDKGKRQANIDSALKRNIPRCIFRAKPRKDSVAIVASGPSVAHEVETLRNFEGQIWAINGAFEWLRKRGLRYDAFVGIDPEWFLKDYLLEPIPTDCTYYLGACVDPQVFDHLKNHNVRMWFPADGEVKYPRDAPTVPGGSSCLGRAPYLAYMLGFVDVHLFGGDSSYTDRTHVYSEPGNCPTKEQGMVLAQANGKVFKSAKNMILQATDMVEIVTNFPGTITIHGGGLMPEMCQEMKDTGILEQLVAEEAAILGGMNRKDRRSAQRHLRRNGFDG
jgi:uncharacterized Rossmann fold enzyme